MRTVHEDAAVTAKRIRSVLKKNWPDQKFSVTTKKYSGGSSVSVRWVDGPTVSEVQPQVQLFEGADFDGMQDLKTYTGFLAMEGDEMVKVIGAHYIFCDRTRSDALEKVLEAKILQDYGPEAGQKILGGYEKYRIMTEVEKTLSKRV